MDRRTLIIAEDLFWAKVDQSGGPEACWLWTAARGPKGYGRFNVRLNGVRCRRQAHAIAWLLAGRELPPGQCVLHSCDVPSCVNPQHLFVGSRADNNEDMIAKGRQARGMKNGMAKFTDDQVRALVEDFKTGVLQQKQLMRKYQMSRRAVRRILAGEGWRHVVNISLPTAARRALGLKNAKTKLTAAQVIEIRRAYKGVSTRWHRVGPTLKELAQTHNVSIQSIAAVVRGSTWRHI